jgi:hypothetical protein
VLYEQDWRSILDDIVELSHQTTKFLAVLFNSFNKAISNFKWPCLTHRTLIGDHHKTVHSSQYVENSWIKPPHFPILTHLHLIGDRIPLVIFRDNDFPLLRKVSFTWLRFSEVTIGWADSFAYIIWTWNQVTPKNKWYSQVTAWEFSLPSPAPYPHMLAPGSHVTMESQLRKLKKTLEGLYLVVGNDIELGLKRFDFRCRPSVGELGSLDNACWEMFEESMHEIEDNLAEPLPLPKFIEQIGKSVV